MTLIINKMSKQSIRKGKKSLQDHRFLLTFNLIKNIVCTLIYAQSRVDSIIRSQEEGMKRFTVKLMMLLLGFALLVAGNAQAAEVPLKVLEGVEFHAFASSSYTFNTNMPTQRAPNSATNVNRVYDTDHNSFKFDVGELVMLKEAAKPGSIGFRTDLTYGFSQPEVNQSASDTGDAQSTQFDVQQGYVTYNAPIGTGLQLDFGKFITHIGAEVMDGYDGWNYNFSRSWLFSFGPFTHTGLRASYKINDMISVLGMVANGWDNTVENNDGKSLGAQIAITPNDSVSLLLNWVSGPETIGNQPSFSNDTTNLFDAVLDIALTDSTLVQLNMAYGIQANGAAGTRGDAEWWGISTIVRHDYNKWFSLNLRGQVFNDLDGTRATTAATLPTGQGQELWAVTVTPEVRISQNMVVRLEYRHDQSNQKAFWGSGAGDTRKTQNTFALNGLFYF
jgi:opacity protein-like surface antigen